MQQSTTPKGIIKPLACSAQAFNRSSLKSVDVLMWRRGPVFWPLKSEKHAPPSGHQWPLCHSPRAVARCQHASVSLAWGQEKKTLPLQGAGMGTLIPPEHGTYLISSPGNLPLSTYDVGNVPLANGLSACRIFRSWAVLSGVLSLPLSESPSSLSAPHSP